MSTSCTAFRSPAVVEWTVDSQTYHLSHPDPRSSSITFESRNIDGASSSIVLQLHIPVHLKDVKFATYLMISLCPNAIASIDFETFASPQPVVLEKLECSTVCLHFHLRNPVTRIIAPASAAQPLRPKRLASGQVLDALRSLASATSFKVYVPDTALSTTKAQAICDAVSKYRLQSQDDDGDGLDLASLYSGSGGQLIDPSARLDDEPPPSYHEVESTSPPPPPPLTSDNKKRRRLHSPDKVIESGPGPETGKPAGLEALWARLISHEARSEERIHELEKQVKSLKEDNVNLHDQLSASQDREERSAATIIDLENELLEAKQRVDDLEDQVEELLRNGFDDDTKERMVANVTDSVLENLQTETYNTTMTFVRKCP